MPMISSLKSACTHEKKVLIKEESGAQKLIQADLGDSLLLKYLMSVGKVLMNLEVKLGQLESTNQKLVDKFEQSEDAEGAEHFQTVLDEESEFIDGVLTRKSELKILKGEVERKRTKLETAQSPVLVSANSTQQTDHTQLSSEIASIWSPSVQGPTKPPHLEITLFDGNVLKWQEFWDQFEAAIHKAKYSSVDKMNYLKSRLTGEALDAILGTSYPITIIM